MGYRISGLTETQILPVLDQYIALRRVDLKKVTVTILNHGDSQIEPYNILDLNKAFSEIEQSFVALIEFKDGRDEFYVGYDDLDDTKNIYGKEFSFGHPRRAEPENPEKIDRDIRENIVSKIDTSLNDAKIDFFFEGKHDDIVPIFENLRCDDAKSKILDYLNSN